MDPVHPTRRGKPRAGREGAPHPRDSHRAGAGAGASPGVHSPQLCQVQHIRSFSCNTWPRASLHKSLPLRETPSLCLKGGRGPQIEISTSPAFEVPGTQVTMPHTPSRSADIFIVHVPGHVKSSGSTAVQNGTSAGSTHEAPPKHDSKLPSSGLRRGGLGGPAGACGPRLGFYRSWVTSAVHHPCYVCQVPGPRLGPGAGAGR